MKKFPLRQFLSAYRRYFVYAGVFSLFINLLQLSVPIFMLQIFDRVLASRSLETLSMLALVTAGGLLVMLALEILRGHLLLALSVRFDAAVGPKVLGSLMQRGTHGTDGEAGGGLRDVAVLRGFLSGSGLVSCFDAPWVIPYILLIFLFHPLLGSVALVGAILLFGLAWLNEKVSREGIESMGEQVQRASSWINGSLRNADVIAALGMRRSMTQRWERLNEQVLELQEEGGKRSGMVTGLSRWLRQMIQVVMLAVGAFLIIGQEASPGVMIATTIILGRALGPVESMIRQWRGVVEARQSYHRLEDLLARFGVHKGAEGLPSVDGRLAVENLVFAHPGAEKRLVVNRVSFSLKAGESAAIIGPSAAGKSTLARLVVGILQPTAGTVRLDGMSVSEWEKESLGPHIGYLPQDVELFAGTVAENIGRMQERPLADIIEAAVAAGAHDMILRLPQGYETEIGEGGGMLSAGQRQRIGLARALFGQPELVVLDEPNANLDAEGEQALLQALAALKERGTTTLLVTHKPSITGSMDKVLVLANGQVRMFGARKEVLEQLSMQGTVKTAVGAMQ